MTQACAACPPVFLLGWDSWPEPPRPRTAESAIQDEIYFPICGYAPRSTSRAGYQTRAIGKMHYWPERGRIGFDDVILRWLSSLLASAIPECATTT